MKSNLFFKSLFCIALLFSGFGINKAWADHISSTEMYVDYIGTGPNDMTYQVTMITYRVCIATNLVLFPTVGINVASANLNFSQGLTLNQVGPEDTVDQLCPDFSKINSCRVLANTQLPGYVRRRYVNTITVPGRSVDLKFSWSSCCRLLSFVNGGLSESFYLEVGINNTIKYDNSTPRYNSLPYAFYCTNQAAEFANDPYDPNNDSLVTYKLDPQQSPTLNITYLPGFTTVNPVGSSTGYTVNPVSGIAKFTPPSAGRYTVAFRTEDYDKPSRQRMSYTSRDIVFSVLNCSNLPPKTDDLPIGIVGTKKVDTTGGNIRILACPQVPLSFKVNATSNNPNGLIYMYADETVNPLPAGMTVIPTLTGGTGYVTVSWTPTAADLGTRVISIIAVDSTCAPGQELVLRKKFTFTIDVRPGLDAGPDLLACPLGDKPVRLGSNASPTSTISWTDLSGAPAEFLSCTDCPNPLASPTREYTFVIHTNDSLLCKSDDSITIFLDTTVIITAPQDLLVVCRPANVNLLSVTTGPAPLANLPCGTLNPVVCLTQDQDTADVGAGINPALQPTNTPFYSGKRYHKYQFIIPKQELLAAGFYSGTITSLSFLDINPTVLGATPLENLNISLGCVPLDNFPLPISNNSFYFGLTNVASLLTYTLTPNDWNQINLATPYSWDTTQNLIVDICMGPMTTPNASGNDPVAMMPGLAIQKSDDGIDVCGGSVPIIQTYTQRPVVRFTYCPSPELPFVYSWLPGTFLEDSTKQNPSAFIPRSIDYAVYTVGRNGCRVRDSLHVIVPIHKLNVGPQDTITCRNQIVPLYATGGDAYQWFEVQGGVFSDASSTLTCTDCSNPVATPPVTTTYAVVFTNNVNQSNPIDTPVYNIGCPDTLFTTVNVWQLPPVYTTNADTTIGYGKSVQLFAFGASKYTWTPVGSLSNPNSPAPIAMPKETTNYIVSGMDSNGCVYRDTVKVTVDYRDNILVPSAFTPNGDGRNDVFKIVNVSFQRLMEFRVFNRWGQEIYSTTDISKGWDGSWKGVAQEIGNYQYIIRVGYPDGNVETYKGDINLIK